jgi:hypothetical protein
MISHDSRYGAVKLLYATSDQVATLHIPPYFRGTTELIPPDVVRILAVLLGLFTSKYSWQYSWLM